MRKLLKAAAWLSLGVIYGFFVSWLVDMVPVLGYTVLVVSIGALLYNIMLEKGAKE